MADGAQAAPRQDALVTANGSRMLKTSKGRARVKLDDLGPAIFNRMGADTCGRHCLKLLTRIVKVEGFATYRYVAAWCHEPDPHAPLVVAEHGNKMGSRDGLLPKYRIEPLKGLFAKTHLATALLALSQGRFPALMDVVKKNPGDHVDLMEALTDGIYVEVFPWAAVQANRGAFLELMASDNFDHAHGMVESEMRCISAVRHSLQTAVVQPGQSQWDIVLRDITRLSGQKWQDKDVGAFWNFARTTLARQHDLLTEIWHFSGCESVLTVEAAFFERLSKLPAAWQWQRLCCAVAQILSDPETECIAVGGTHVACAVSDAALKKVKSQAAAAGDGNEAWLDRALKDYYFELTPKIPPATLEDEMVKQTAAFLARAYTHIGRETAIPSEVRSKLEEKWRTGLAKAALSQGVEVPLPARITPLPKPDAANLPRAWKERLEQTGIAADASGCAIVTPKRSALEAGFGLDTAARRRTAPRDGAADGAAAAASQNDSATASDSVTASSQNAKIRGIVRGYGSTGVLVRFAGEERDLECAVAESELVPEKNTAEAQVELPDGIKWALTSTKDNAAMLVHMVHASLYLLYAQYSAAHGEVLVTGGYRVHAKKDFAAGALHILPFNQSLCSVEGGVPKNAALLSWIVGAGPAATDVTYGVRAKPIPKKAAAGEEEAVALTPFWALVAKAEAEGTSDTVTLEGKAEGAAVVERPAAVLSYATLEAKVAPGPIWNLKGVHAHKAPAARIRLVYLTNTEPIKRGYRLCVRTGPPETMPEVAKPARP